MPPSITSPQPGGERREHRRARSYYGASPVTGLRVAFVVCLTLSTPDVRAQSIRVDERPGIRIDEQLDSAAQFTRITAAFQLSTGQLVVADARVPSVRVFGPDGRFQRNLGRSGGGPGEFMNVTLLPPVADTILVWDGRQRRITRYLSDGRLAGNLRVLSAGDGRPISVVARLANGRWLVVTPYTPSLMRPGGTFNDSIRVGTMAATGMGSIVWMGWFPGTTFFVWKPNATADHGDMVGFARFAAATRVLAAGGAVIIASGGTNDVVSFDERGRRVHFRLPGERGPVPEMARSRARAAALAEAQTDRMRAFVEASYDRSALPALAPVFDNAAWYAGELWLELFTPDGNAPTRYRVLRSDGSALGEVRFPPRARLLDVGRDFVWIAVADDDGVERLERYGLRR